MVKMIYLLKTTKFIANLNDVMERFDMEIIDTVVSVSDEYNCYNLQEMVYLFKQNEPGAADEIQFRLSELINKYIYYTKKQNNLLPLDEIRYVCDDAVFVSLRRYKPRSGPYIRYFRSTLYYQVLKFKSTFIERYYNQDNLYVVPLSYQETESYMVEDYSTQEQRYRSFAEKLDLEDLIETLSPLDREIVNLLVQGYTVSEIAKLQNRSYQLIRNRIYSIQQVYKRRKYLPT
jgi:hypothetical protein